MTRFGNCAIICLMTYCEYCGGETELIGKQYTELDDSTKVTEERRHCLKCSYKFYVMLDNKENEDDGSQHTD